jgi:hypothetical protein
MPSLTRLLMNADLGVSLAAEQVAYEVIKWLEAIWTVYKCSADAALGLCTAGHGVPQV